MLKNHRLSKSEYLYIQEFDAGKAATTHIMRTCIEFHYFDL